MARKPNSYWEKRSTEMMEEYERYTENTISKLIKIYEKTQENIEKNIKTVYRNYSKNGKLSKEVLDAMLNKEQAKLYHDNLREIIKLLPNSDFRKKLLTKYNAPAYAYRISRLESLKISTEAELIKLANIEERITRNAYEKIIQDGYYKTIYEIQKGIGLNFSFADLDSKTVNLMLTDGWYNKENFSSRVWDNRQRLSEYISTNLLSDSLAGKPSIQSAKELSEAMNVGRFQATRLVRTEVNHFANESEMLAYKECGIEKYRYIATLDAVTCVHCARLDNKVFLLSEKKNGVNFPPLHPFDRCTTIAEFDNDNMNDLQRRARNPETGENYILDKNISYEEWSKQNAPGKYKKYFIDYSLPKVKSVEDSILDKQLGFYNDGNNLRFIPKSSIITNVHIIAGNGTKTKFRSAEKYASEYGGASEEWMKKTGKIESSKYIFDVHWVEHEKYGKYDFKLKGKSLK